MRYSKFIISNYKAIKGPIEINLDKSPLIPIIGINECGKTTILNSIFAFDFTNDLSDNSVRHLTDVHNLYDTSIAQTKITAEITLSIEELRGIITFYNAKLDTLEISEKEKRKKPVIGKKFNSKISITREITTGNQVSLYRIEPNEYLKDIINEDEFCKEVIRISPYILFFDDFRDAFPDRIEIVEASLNTQPYWITVINELFKKTNTTYSIYDLPTYEKRHQKNVLRDVAKTLNTTLSKEWLNFKLDEKDALEIAVELDTEETSITQNINNGTGINKSTVENKVTKNFLRFEVVEKSNQGLERTFYVRDRSKGFYWFFNFVMKLEFNPKVTDSTDGNTVYLLDEPGSYLHPFAQQKLCKKLVELSKNNKVIYCTHTHYLLDPRTIPINTIHITEKINNEIKLSKFNDFKVNTKGVQSAFQPIWDALYIKPLDIGFQFKKILVVEGIYDYYSFDIFCKERTFGIMPSKGADGMINLISILIGFDTDFIVLWDLDDAGTTNYDKATIFFGEDFAQKHFRTLPKNETNSSKVILQNLYEDSDMKLIKENLELPDNSAFNKTISSFYFSQKREEILTKISKKNKK